MKNVNSPIIATYEGNEIGDYLSITFLDTNGRKSYDFGFGNNDFGEVLLFNKAMVDNPNYFRKTFKVYWEWKISTFPCCDGNYKTVKAYLPSITRLELIETLADKK